jgi:putative heme transporter
VTTTEVRPALAAPPPAPSRRRRTRWLTVVLSVALVVAAFVGVLPRIASYDDAWARIASAHPATIALLVALGLWNLASYWPLLCLSLPGLTWRQAAISTQASTAVANTVPAGGAWGAGVTISLYRRWGFGAVQVARSMVVTGLWNVGVKLALPVVAAVALVVVDGSAPVAIAVASTGVLGVVALVAFALVGSDAPARELVGRVERLVARAARRLGRRSPTGWVAAAERVRLQIGELVATRSLALTAAALVSHLSLFAVLAAAMALTSLTGVSLPEAFAVFAAVRVALVVPLTPGGAGVAEVGLAALLVAAGADAAPAVATALVFRAVTWGLPVVLGAACWLVLLRGGRSRGYPR